MVTTFETSIIAILALGFVVPAWLLALSFRDRAKAMRVENPVLPSSVITDADGNVLEVMRGIPTLSEVRKWRRPQR